MYTFYAFRIAFKEPETSCDGEANGRKYAPNGRRVADVSKKARKALQPCQRAPFSPFRATIDNWEESI